MDCWSLIEFCRDLENHKRTANLRASMETQSSRGDAHNRKVKSLNPLPQPFCNHSPFSFTDIVMLLLALGSIGILAAPYLKLIYHEASELLPETIDRMGDVVCHVFVAYAAGIVLMLITAIGLWEVVGVQFRKCGNPKCRGLRKSVEIDIQLESEECVRFMPPVPKDSTAARPLQLGQGQKELEAELKKMAPLNGRTVLIFRSPCGCPDGRMEIWGPKKSGRIKKNSFFVCFAKLACS